MHWKRWCFTSNNPTVSSHLKIWYLMVWLSSSLHFTSFAFKRLCLWRGATPHNGGSLPLKGCVAAMLQDGAIQRSPRKIGPFWCWLMLGVKSRQGTFPHKSSSSLVVKMHRLGLHVECHICNGSVKMQRLVLHFERHISMFQACCSAPKMEVWHVSAMEALKRIVWNYI